MKRVEFDSTAGKGVELNENQDAHCNGLCLLRDEKCYAVYAQQQKLFFQIGSERWDLFSADVSVTYFHRYAAEKTIFRIEGATTFELQYDAWWKDRPDFEVEPMAASCEPENVDEDFFGFVAYLADNQDAAIRAHKAWMKNAQ